MSTKNLARTALEAGTVHSTRIYLNRRDRRAINQHLHECVKDPELWDDGTDPIQSRPGWDEGIPGENLSPVYAWVDSHVGDVWNDTYSELCSRWPIRTLAGYHIIVDHILRDVDQKLHPDKRWHGSWFVDEDGILQRHTDGWRTYQWKKDPLNKKELEIFFQGRSVIIYSETSVSWVGSIGKPHTHTKWEKDPMGWIVALQGEIPDDIPVEYKCICGGHSRQGPKLTPEELKTFNSLREDTRDRHTHVNLEERLEEEEERRKNGIHPNTRLKE